MELEPFSVFSQSEPMFMVHKGWKESEESKGDLTPELYPSQQRARKGPLCQARERATVPQKFEFVNGTTPFVNKNNDIRRLIRAHVVRDSSGKKRNLANLRTGKKRLQSLNDARESIEGAEFSSSIDEVLSEENQLAMSISRSSHAPFSLPPSLDPNPQLSPIIYQVKRMGTAMWPLEDHVRFNPISPAGWFDWALSDAALFHAILYTTSTYAGLILGTTESKEAIVHEGKSMSLVNQRLSSLSSLGSEKDGGKIDDGTIGAVSCLAITEALRGNVERWRIHMQGMKQMVGLKGGISKMSLTLQLKLHRADLTGSVDLIASPFFADHNQLPKYSSIVSSTLASSTVNKSLLKFLTILPLDQNLVNTLITLSNFSHQLSQILDSPTVANIPFQITLLKETYGLRYSLLQSSTIDSEIAPLSLSDEMLNDVLRIGALLYIQATLQEFPFSAVGSRNLVKGMKDSVMTVRIRNQKEGELMVWMLFMGGIETRDEADRVWFVEQIGKLVGRLGMVWEGVMKALEELWWVAKIHEQRCRRLWDEVEIERVKRESTMIFQ